MGAVAEPFSMVKLLVRHHPATARRVRPRKGTKHYIRLTERRFSYEGMKNRLHKSAIPRLAGAALRFAPPNPLGPFRPSQALIMDSQIAKVLSLFIRAAPSAVCRLVGARRGATCRPTR